MFTLSVIIQYFYYFLASNMIVEYSGAMKLNLYFLFHIIFVISAMFLFLVQINEDEFHIICCDTVTIEFFLKAIF